MASKSLLTAEQYAALDEPEGVRYELSDGELIVSTSPTGSHNDLRDEFTVRLRPFVKTHNLGLALSEMDLKLAANVIRRPDVIFIRAARLKGISLDQSPLPLAPDLAIEIISRNDRADDLLLKVSQYLRAGAQAVWLIYPKSHLAYRYVPGKLGPEVRATASADKFDEPDLLPGLSFPLAEVMP
jgi:Uma2 family endonuclease